MRSTDKKRGVEFWVDTGSVFGKFKSHFVERPGYMTDRQWDKQVEREMKKLDKALKRRKDMKYKITQRIIGLLMMMVVASSCSEDRKFASSALKQQESESICSVTPVLKTWFDTSKDCASQPEIDRVFGGKRFEWNGVTYLLVIHGNELKVYDKSMATTIAASNFRVQNVGDSDYDLLNATVCDDCRYGVANYKAGTVFFDLGRGSAPEFTRHVQDANHVTPGSFTWWRDGQQYLVKEHAACSGMSGQFTYDDIENITFMECLPVGNIMNGLDVDGAYYMADKSTQVYLYDWQDGALHYSTAPFEAFSTKFPAMDRNGDILAVANRHGMALYDVEVPNVPVLLSNTPGDWNRVTFADDIVAVAKQGYAGTERFFDVRHPLNPSGALWLDDDTYPCSKIMGFGSIDDVIYLMRWSNGRIATTSCPPLPTPTPEPDVLFEDGFESGDTGRWAQ